MRRVLVLLIVLSPVLLLLMLRTFAPGVVAPIVQQMRGRKTVAQRVAQYREAVRARLAPDFARLGFTYPPRQVVLVGLKDERMLEVWVAGQDSKFGLLKTYPILGVSGTLGPKLREGDLQVPEGLYRVESLNPNSMFHLSLRLDYPNAFDKAKAELDGRTNLGGDIMIHGGTASIGCLAMGDGAAEDLFVLVSETGTENVSVILSPIDLRARKLSVEMPVLPAWAPGLYESIRGELIRLGPH